MKRLMIPLFAGLLVVLLVLPSSGGSRPPLAGTAGTDAPKPIVLAFRPAAAPVPVLRYRLLPELMQQQPGNAAEVYYLAFIYGRPNVAPKEYEDALEQWEKAPLDAIRKVVPKRPPGKPLDISLIDTRWLREIDRAARRRFVDWGMVERLKADGIGTLLPEAQRLRDAARLLSLRARLQMAQGHFADAVASLETGFAMGRHIGEGPTLITSLVGFAIVQVMIQRMEELVQQPGAPNLYWALTYLPTPLIDLRTGLQGERLWLESILPGAREVLANPKARPMPPDRVRDFAKMLRAINDNRSTFLREPPKPGILLKDADWPAVRQALRDNGWTAEQLDTVAAIDAYCLYQVLIVDRYLDEMAKCLSLPYPIAKPFIQQVEDRVAKEARKEPGQELAALVLPAVGKVYRAQARLERSIALMRAVEALRLYAAAHGGKLSAKLADVTEVPIPTDPITGRPFEYRLEGKKGVLIAPTPTGEGTDAGNTKSYELVPAK